jgi:diaminopimelate decarboxylase
MHRYLEPRWDFLSTDKRGRLYIEDVPVKDLADKYGTPLQIIVEDKLRQKLREFRNSFPYHKLRTQYACKCNSNLEIMRIVREEGWELDASSVGEIILALIADFRPEQITFTNLYKTEQDITFAAQVGVRAITVDSMEELERVCRVAQRLKKHIRIFLRFNLLLKRGMYNTRLQQYGISVLHAKKAIKKAKAAKYVDIVGFHFHGSYIKDPKIYKTAAARLVELAAWARDNCGVRIRAIDLGGGFPFEHKGRPPFTPMSMGSDFVAYFYKLLSKYRLIPPTLIFEPGKYVMGNAGMGLAKVIARKPRANKVLIVVDGSAYTMIPDALIYHQYYDIIPATDMHKRVQEKVDIRGCTCDCADIMASDRKLPRLYQDDLVAVMDCGAYSNVMASNFNTLRRPPMVLIKPDGKTKLIRRRDQYSEMFAPELDVLKVADPNELKKLYSLRVNIDKMWRGQKK